MKKVAAILTLLVAGTAVADTLDGSKILEQEAQRAQELQRLQHQAEVLKQRAEITRYLDEIKKNGGDVSDLDLTGLNVNAGSVKPAPSAPRAAPRPAMTMVKSGDDVIPKLLHIEDNRAAFETEKGTLYAHVGSILPGGYKVVSLNMRNGARLQKNGVQYDIDVTW